jgi:hypothetical protein
MSLPPRRNDKVRHRDDMADRDDGEAPDRAVEFTPGPEPVCEAMRALAGKRLLVRDAPLLPLPGCDQPMCGCQYKFSSDRRTDIRRRADAEFRVTEVPYGQPFLLRRAAAKGRRKTDV